MQREYRAAIQLQQVDDKGCPLILPVLLESCEIPVFLKDILWADFRAGYDPAFRLIAQSLGLSEPVIPSVEFGEDLKRLSKRVESDFQFLLTNRVNFQVPNHDLFDKWSPHEVELLRLLATERTSARRIRLDRTKWQIGTQPDVTGKVPIDDEPWPKADFYLSVCEVVVEVLQMAARHGIPTTLPLNLGDLFKMTGAEFRD